MTVLDDRLRGRDDVVTRGAIVRDPDMYEQVWRSGRMFVGLRVDLAKVFEARARELVESAWRNKAPKRLVAAHDE